MPAPGARTGRRSSMTSAPAIGFDYAPSRWLRRVLLLVAALAVLAVMLCSLPLWIRLALVVVVLLAARRTHRQLALPVVAAAGWGTGLDAAHGRQRRRAGRAAFVPRARPVRAAAPACGRSWRARASADAGQQRCRHSPSPAHAPRHGDAGRGLAAAVSGRQLRGIGGVSPNT